MSNIEFSKVGKAILKNKRLAEYITHRLANITDLENKQGYIQVELNNGASLTLRFGKTAILPGKRKTLSAA